MIVNIDDSPQTLMGTSSALIGFSSVEYPLIGPLSVTRGPPLHIRRAGMRIGPYKK